MRISTVTMFEQSTASMNRQQSDLMKVSQQIAPQAPQALAQAMAEQQQP